MESTFVILGATGGIGSALVRRLTAAGHHVLAAGRAASFDRAAPAARFVTGWRRPPAG